MGRVFAGVAAVILLMAGGFFFWKSHVDAEQIVPPAPEGAAFVAPLRQQPLSEPPAASEKSKEEKRFARGDKDDDGQITLAELMEPRRKAFAKLDTNGDGRLSIEEWAVKTSEKFTGADADRNGALTPAEYATTKPKPPKRKKCAC